MDHIRHLIPEYLAKYCVKQNYGKYTRRDQSVWRYIMRQSRSYFKDHAVSVYLDGLEKTGITTDKIPSIVDMDEKLQDLGWRAVAVEGFIPPSAFLEFQARKILPIASDMRSVEHIHYTPAPDIVHEAAGHAPIIADPGYSEYLTKYAAMAQKAIFSKEDLHLYEAIRVLSDVKENYDSTPEMIKAAEENLKLKSAAVKDVSEANKVARMYWWTVEYGLMGTLSNPKIYGAGLLSSIGESQNCLSSKIKKIRLSPACVETGYDITEPQPQLFVADSISHLTEVLAEFETSLSFRQGGIYGLEMAKSAGTVTTVVLDSGAEISGIVTDFELSPQNTPVFIRWQGRVQLSEGGEQLPGQGPDQHPEGFSTPLGPIKDDSFQSYVRKVEKGKRSRLEFQSGIVVEGIIGSLIQKNGKVLGIKWLDCHVFQGEKTFFQPSWGDFDMLFGEKAISVYGGPADRIAYGDFEIGQATTSPGRKSPFTPSEESLFRLYTKVNHLRLLWEGTKDQTLLGKEVETFYHLVEEKFPEEWLIKIELIELASKAGVQNTDKLIVQLLEDAKSRSNHEHWLVVRGIGLRQI